MPSVKTSLRAEQRGLREQMRALGMSHRQIAVEFARRYNLRPRAAWRHAHGWSLKEAAEGINTYAAHHGLHSDGATVAMTGPHLCEHENWPGHGPEPTGRRPTPYLLSLLAAVYGCSVHDLLDAADYLHLPPADRLILGKAMSASRAGDHDPAPARSAVAGRVGGPPQPGPGSPLLFRTAARSAPVLPETAWPGGERLVVPRPLGPLAAALLSAPQAAEAIEPQPVADQVTHVWRLRQEARYRQLADDLPQALASARRSETEPESARSLAALAALTHLYNAASSLAKSLGSFELAGIAADRAVRSAGASGDPLLGGGAAYRLANVLLSGGQLGPAKAVAIGAADRLRPVMTASRSHTAMWGALLATAALAAARARAAAQAWELLGASKVAAELLITEQADVFSIFGPVNWLIHAVHVAADLSDGAQAIRRAGQVPADRLPSFLAERRTFLLLGTARGHTLRNDAASATRVLLEAEHVAPEELRHSPDARALVAELLARTPVRNEPLRELAVRISHASTAAATGDPP